MGGLVFSLEEASLTHSSIGRQSVSFADREEEAVSADNWNVGSEDSALAYIPDA